MLAVLAKRFGKYGLTLHPDKTRLVRFIRPVCGAKKDRTNGTFDFLGFTHICSQTTKGRYWVKFHVPLEEVSGCSA